MWASTEDTIEGRYDSEFEPAAGYAVIDVEAADHAAAHALVVPAVLAADPEQTVIVAGDLGLRPITEH